MKTAFIIITSIIFINLVTPSYSFGQNSGYLIIRVMESPDKAYSKIIVTENEQKLEVVDLEPLYYKNLEVNQIEINKILDKYKTKKYSLKYMTSGNGGNQTILVTTYIFEKE